MFTMDKLIREFDNYQAIKRIENGVIVQGVDWRYNGNIVYENVDIRELYKKLEDAGKLNAVYSHDFILNLNYIRNIQFEHNTNKDYCITISCVNGKIALTNLTLEQLKETYKNLRIKQMQYRLNKRAYIKENNQ